MGQAATFYHQHHFIYLINITLVPLLKVAICVLSNGKTLIYSSRGGTTISTRPLVVPLIVRAMSWLRKSVIWISKASASLLMYL